jgi:RNA polymerase sigma factor (sigma-70 family)
MIYGYLDDAKQIITKEIITNAKNGCNESMEAIITKYVAMILSITKKRYMSNNVIDTEDLIQEGIMGLMKSVEKFDMSKNFELSTYSSFWIKRFINDTVMEFENNIKIPKGVILYLRKIMDFKYNYIMDNNKNPNNLDIIEFINTIKGECNISNNQMELILYYSNIKTYESKELEIGVYDNISKYKEDKYEVFTLLKILSKKERDIIIYRMEGYTLERVSKVFTCTKQRISMIELGAIEKLRKYCKRRGLTMKDFII